VGGDREPSDGGRLLPAAGASHGVRMSLPAVALIVCFLPELTLLLSALLAALAGALAGSPALSLVCFTIGVSTMSLLDNEAGQGQHVDEEGNGDQPGIESLAGPINLDPRSSNRPKSGPWDPAVLQLSDQEHATVQRLGARILATCPVQSSRDITACRFLIGSKYDENRASRALDAYAQWRASLEEDVLYSPEIERAIAKVYSPQVMRFRDPKGRPVVLAKIGNIDVSMASSMNVSVAMLLRRHISTLDKISAKIEESADPLGGHLLIQDLSGCSVTKFIGSRAFFKRMLKVDQNYYPHLLGEMVCVHAPRLATWAFHQLKPFIDPATAKKVTITRDGPAEALRGRCSPELIEEIMQAVNRPSVD